MSEDNKETTENTETPELTPEEQYLEDSFKLFGIFRMTWPDIKNLSEEDRVFLVKRADEVEERAKEQAMARQQQQEMQQQQQMAQQQAMMQQVPGGGMGGGIVTPDSLVTPSQLQI
tara:strand:+ start:1051 stop:1398 length:348 start_codon:yes stop_codon:yes gene_type:complete